MAAGRKRTPMVETADKSSQGSLSATETQAGPVKALHEMSQEEWFAYRAAALDGLIAVERRRAAGRVAENEIVVPDVGQGPLSREAMDAFVGQLWARGKGS